VPAKRASVKERFSLPARILFVKKGRLGVGVLLALLGLTGDGGQRFPERCCAAGHEGYFIPFRTPTSGNR